MKHISKTEEKAKEVINKVLSEIPILSIVSIDQEVPIVKEERDLIDDIDLVVKLKLETPAEQLIIVEVKSNGQPRYATQAVNQLLRYRQKYPDAYYVFMAPYISARSVDICRGENIGYIDFSGNCYLAFKGVFVERTNYPDLFQEKRQLRSLFSPRATRVLRALLNEPYTLWKIKDLSAEARVSIGLVSNVKHKLLEQNLIQEKDEGILLSNPELLLNSWSANYSYESNHIYQYYTVKSVSEIENEVAKLCNEKNIEYALTGFSGAARLAPSVRYNQATVFVDPGEIEKVASSLDLYPTARGANIWLWAPYDEGVFYGAKTMDNIRIASPEQVYLDLKSFHDRGDEAAGALLEEVLKPKW